MAGRHSAAKQHGWRQGKVAGMRQAKRAMRGFVRIRRLG